MKNLSFIFVIVLFLAGTTVVNAQADGTTATHTVGIAINKVALVDIETSGSSANINLNPVAPTEAGLGLSFDGVTNSDLWLNYSSIVENKKTRNITASISNTLPAGISLKLAATNITNASSKGAKGTSSITTAQVLSSTALNVITGIGSCYTGNGAKAGSNLTYSVVVNDDNYETLLEGSYSTTVTYTITADN